MPSKKAVFEAKDTSNASGNVMGTRNSDNEAPVEKVAFESRDLSQIDFNTGEPVEESDGVAEKPTFYTPDTELGSTDPSAGEKKKKYVGVERRRHNRRSGADRRGDVRFDLDKSDRRENQGRREDDYAPKYW